MLSAFALYFTLLISIGFTVSRKMKSATDFIIGSHSVNYWVTAIATQASDMGSWLFLGFPAAIFSHGLFEFWTAIGLVTFMLLNWHFIAPRLRQLSEKKQILTISSFFERQFKDNSGYLRLISAFISLIFFTFYISAGLVGLGRLFESAFGITYHSGIIIALTTAALYTLIGGFVSIAWCDLFQGMFLLTVIVFVPTYVFFLTGGVNTIINAASMKNVSLSLISSPRDMINAVLLACSWGLGYFGQPHILINFMGIDDARKIRHAKYVGISWQIIVLSASAAIGLVGLAFFPHGLADTELLFIIMAKTLFHPFIAGLFLCAILAATLSTMDSHILVSGSVLASDLYKKVFNKAATSQQILLMSRLGSLAICCVALMVAWKGTSTIYGLVNYAWSGLGSSFGPLVLAALYGKNITRQGALAGLIVGGCTSAIWPYLNTTILPLVPGFLANFLAMYSVSIMTRK